MDMDMRPTWDQIYLGEKFSIGIPTLQKLNYKYGVEPVVAAQRMMAHIDRECVRIPVAYLKKILDEHARIAS